MADWSVPAIDPHKFPLVDDATRELLAYAAAKIKPPPVLPPGHPQRRPQPRWDRHAEHGYLQQACVIANSLYSLREEFIHCGEPGYFGSFACSDVRFCPRCAFNSAARLLKRFKTAFATAVYRGLDIFYLVLSTTRNERAVRLSLDNEMDFGRLRSERVTDHVDQHLPFLGADIFPVNQLFGMYSRAMKEFFSSRRNRFGVGYVGGPEIALKFVPLGVIPHANFIVFARPGFAIEDMRHIQRNVKISMRNSRRFQRFSRRLGGIHPVVRAWRLNSQADLNRVINYILKPVAIWSAYVTGYVDHGRDGAGAAQLNRDVNEFLANVHAAFEGNRRLSYVGVCHGGSRRYIGQALPKPEGAKPNAKAEKARQKSRKMKPRDEDGQWDQFIADRMDEAEVGMPPRLGAYRRWKLANQNAGVSLP